MMATQTAGWHVPSGDDFVAAFVAMKSPTRNPDLWGRGGDFRGRLDRTSEPESPRHLLSSLTFKQRSGALRGLLVPTACVCIGKDSSGASTPPQRRPQLRRSRSPRSGRQDCLGRDLAWRMRRWSDYDDRLMRVEASGFGHWCSMIPIALCPS